MTAAVLGAGYYIWRWRFDPLAGTFVALLIYFSPHLVGVTSFFGPPGLAYNAEPRTHFVMITVIAALVAGTLIYDRVLLPSVNLLFNPESMSEENRPAFLSPTNRRWLIGVYYGGIVAIILVMWMVAKYVTPQLEATAPIIAHQDGFAFYFPARGMEGIADTPEFPTRSAITLCEGNRELGPAHSPHSDIRNFGTGRFSHWTSVVIFSASDGTDPRVNGRDYRVRLDGKCGKR